MKTTIIFMLILIIIIWFLYKSKKENFPSQDCWNVFVNGDVIKSQEVCNEKSICRYDIQSNTCIPRPTFQNSISIYANSINDNKIIYNPAANSENNTDPITIGFNELLSSNTSITSITSIILKNNSNYNFTQINFTITGNQENVDINIYNNLIDASKKIGTIQKDTSVLSKSFNLLFEIIPNNILIFDFNNISPTVLNSMSINFESANFFTPPPAEEKLTPPLPAEEKLTPTLPAEEKLTPPLPAEEKLTPPPPRPPPPRPPPPSPAKEDSDTGLSTTEYILIGVAGFIFLMIIIFSIILYVSKNKEQYNNEDKK